MSSIYAEALQKLKDVKSVCETQISKGENIIPQELFDIIKQSNNLATSILGCLMSEYNEDILYKSDNYSELFEELYSKINNIPYVTLYKSDVYVKEYTDFNKIFLETLDCLLNIEKEMDRIKLLNIASDIKSNVVIIGANGSGKSTFVSLLKESTLPSICVLPAQKYLFFDKFNKDRYQVTVDTYREVIRKTNQIKTGKSNSHYFEMDEAYIRTFTFLITALVKEYSDIITRQHREECDFKNRVPIWDSVEEIWAKLIPDTAFSVNSNDACIDVSKDDINYDINGMSDGEKCILFYIGNVLIAPKNSFIVVDEPETFLNASIYNKLWDMLIHRRPDCQFIFTSHTIEFINSRSNCTYIWCKKFTYPHQFDMRVLEKDLNIPMPLLTELVGSRKPILFCEGTIDSLDYQVYSQLFLDDFYVKPVGGHKNVISYTRSYNELRNLHSNEAIGIIDRDFHDQISLDKYEKDSVYSLPFNEIEMFLLEENIMKSVLKCNNNSDEVHSSIENFKNELILEIKNKKDKIILSATKGMVDSLIKGSLINNFESFEEIESDVNEISNNINVKEIYANISSTVLSCIESQNYNNLLKICNLKGQISGNLANVLLDRDYRARAVKQIEINTDLKSTLRKEYFSNFFE